MKQLIVILLMSVIIRESMSQQAKVNVEVMKFDTYMFSDPDPVANIGRIYPYFRFDGFTNKDKEREWEMIILENEYLKIYVCPEIGGKIWGAIEKSTGKEFLYFNHVVKFRDIAMRGPWTSGGLEYNFGDIGHIPTCATPVDYLVRENDDGSVSCIVGAMDLPSETKWNIEIRLPSDKAYFETRVSWFNTTNIPCTYYHWMNAAAKSSGNLEFIYPGTNYIGHGGEYGQWPMENNRNINWYEDNDFGPYKSYHVMNSYSDYMGGYWHDDEFGFGHYVSYDDKPGKKLWIWGLSQQGMIWEDLLTDSDGQYIEYQTGKLLNQASYSSMYTPFKHKEFMAYDSDVFTELWFPLKGTKGMVAASEYAVLNIEETEDGIQLFLSALQKVNAPLNLEIGDEKITLDIELEPLELFEKEIKVGNNETITLKLGEDLLVYSSNSDEINLKRPIEPFEEFNWESAYGLYTKGLEHEKQRIYTEALDNYLNCLKKDAGFLPAMGRIALEYYRKLDYNLALEYCIQGLSIDTYDPLSNYVYGLVNRKLGNITEAKSGFSIAAQSLEMRSASYTELAKVYLYEHNYKKAIHYSTRAIEFNLCNLSAYEIIAYAYRKSNNQDKTRYYQNKIYDLNGLSDFARFEEFLLNSETINEFKRKITNELPEETYLDLAKKYTSFNDPESAIKILKESPQTPVVKLWLAYLDKENFEKHMEDITKGSAKMVFPYRMETAEILEELLQLNPHWKLQYYLGLIYWNKGRIEDARHLFTQCGNEPELSAFYLAKAELFNDNSNIVKQSVYRAFELDTNSWRAANRLCDIYLESNETSKAIALSKRCNALYPENAKVGMMYAKSLFSAQKYRECLEFLESYLILPYEGSVDGKKMYTTTCIQLSLVAFSNQDFEGAISYAEKAKFWPRNLGVGKPYDVDERLENYIIAKSKEQLGNDSFFDLIVNYETSNFLKENSKMIFEALALKNLGREHDALTLIDNAIIKNPENKYYKWVKAKFLNQPDVESLQNELLSGNTTTRAYDTNYVDRDFELVISILSVLENK